MRSVLIVVLVLVAGCSSSGSPRAASTRTTRPPSGQSSTATASAAPDVAACAAYSHFSDDLARLGSRGSQIVLTQDAEAIGEPLTRYTGRLTAAQQKLMSDAVTLAMHVGSSSWHDHGTPMDPEITAVGDDCQTVK